MTNVLQAMRAWASGGLVAAALALVTTCAKPRTDGASAPPHAGDEPAPRASLFTRRSTDRAHDTLVLYDDTGPYAWLGELYATALVALVSHFGGWAAAPVARYRAGDALDYGAVVYLGSTYDQALPAAFLDDVLGGARPVLWLNDNVWQLAKRDRSFAADFGFLTSTFDTGEVTSIRYKSTVLTRSARNEAGIMRYEMLDETKARAVAWAVRPDGSAFPWAVRSRSLTYVGETPLAYIGPDDRFLALCDLLFDTLAPETPERHRALVRIEDVHPETAPEALRALTDKLAERRVPFALAVIPVYRDPNGAHHAGVPFERRLRDAPRLVDALRDALARGGHLVLHGLTHQYSRAPNPYDGVTAADFEFYRAHLGASGEAILDGPIAEDGQAWALGRVDEALAAFAEAGLPRPTIFEYPHYAGSAADSRAIRTRFDTVYQRETYFSHGLDGAPEDYSHSIQLFFPFVVDDVYGWRVLPENLGHFAPRPFGGAPARSPVEIVASARAARVVRDGFASFFFHPTHDPEALVAIVDALGTLGYDFVSAEALRTGSPP